MNVLPILMAARAVVDIISTPQSQPNAASDVDGAAFSKALQRAEATGKVVDCPGAKALNLISSLPEVSGQNGAIPLHWQVDVTGALSVSRDGANFYPVELSAESRAQVAELFADLAGNQGSLHHFSHLVLDSRQPANFIWQRMSA